MKIWTDTYNYVKIWIKRNSLNSGTFKTVVNVIKLGGKSFFFSENKQTNKKKHKKKQKNFHLGKFYERKFAMHGDNLKIFLNNSFLIFPERSNLRSLDKVACNTVMPPSFFYHLSGDNNVL